MTEQGGSSRLVTFDQPMVTVGRGNDNDLPLHGTGVSTHHCRLQQTAQGITIEDLGSTNGTYVNRRRVSSPTLIGPRDEVVVAIYTLRIVDQASAHAARPTPGPMLASGSAPAGPTVSGPAVPGSAPIPVATSGSSPLTTSGPGPVTTSSSPVTSSSSPVTSSASPLTSGSRHLTNSTSSSVAGPAPVSDPSAAQWAREREKIDLLARTWLAGGRDRKHLLRGSKLAHARQWLAQGRARRSEVKKEHREFIVASGRAQQFRMVRNVSIVAAIVGVVSVGGVQLYRQGATTVDDDGGGADGGTGQNPTEPTEAPLDVAGRRAQSDAIAKQARNVLEQDPELATLLAVEALRLLPERESDLGEAGRVFRRATEKVRGRALRGHEGAITDAAFSSDGRWAITASVDQSARVWDLHADGLTPSVALRGHGQPVRHLAVTEATRWLFTAGDDGSLFRWDLSDADPATTSTRLDGHDAAVTDVAFSADGRALVTGAADGTVKLWNVQANPPVSRSLEGHEGGVSAVALDAKASLVVTGGPDRQSQLTHLDAELQPSRRVRLDDQEEATILDVALAPDGSWALTAASDGTARLWDPTKRYPSISVRVLTGHEAAVERVAITGDSKLALTVGADHKLLVWNLDSKNPELGATTFELHQGEIADLDTTGPGKDPGRARTRYAATASADGSAHTLDLEVRERALDGVRLAVGDPVRAVAFSHDGRWLLTGAADGQARIWDYRARQPGGPSRVGRGHASQVLDVAVNAVGTRMATAGADGTARLWDLLQGGPLREVAVLPAQQGRVRAVTFSPDGELLATAGDDGVIRLWKASIADPAAGHRDLTGHRNVVHDMVFTPDGRILVSISGDRTVRLWKMTREPEKDVVVLDHGDEVNAMSLSDSGRWLFTATVSKLRLFDLQAEDPSASARALKHPHDRDLRAVAISERGTYGASSSEDAVVVLWNFAEGGTSVRLRQHDQPADALAFSPDGRWLATGSRGSVIRLYDLSVEHPEDEPLELRGHDKRIGALRFMQRGSESWLVSAGYDRTIRLWNLEAGKADAIEDSAVVLRGHDELVSALEVGHRGGFVVSGSYDGTARLWPLRPDALVALGCSIIGRALTPQEWSAHLQGSPNPACRGS